MGGRAGHGLWHAHRAHAQRGGCTGDAHGSGNGVARTSDSRRQRGGSRLMPKSSVVSRRSSAKKKAVILSEGGLPRALSSAGNPSRRILVLRARILALLLAVTAFAAPL